jgi:triacylglycerol lipase
MRVIQLSLLAAAALTSTACMAEDGGDELDESKEDARPLGPEPAGNATRFPIIFQQGVGTGENLWFFRGVAERLREDGHVTYQAAFEVPMPAFQSPEVRAEFLAQVVERALADTGAEKVNIVAHSMGGLDARVLARMPAMQGKIASVTTISTPHFGSRIADVALGLVEADRTGVATALGNMYGELVAGHISDNEDIRAGLFACSEKRAPSFNAENPNVDGVFYQSWAGLSNLLAIGNPLDSGACDGKMMIHTARRHIMNALLVPAAAFVAGAGLKPNDGFVTIESSKWGQFNGCVPADHIDELGMTTGAIFNRFTGFDHLRFYRNLAFDLERRGF